MDVNLEAPYTVLEPGAVEVSDEEAIIRAALENPQGSQPFEDFIAGTKKLLVLVNDATRPTPTARILDVIRPALTAHADVRFLVATGAHRAPTEDEYRYIFGDMFDEWRSRILAHDARRDEDMVRLGTSSNGTEMLLNKMVTEADGVLVIGSVEPHYFAGYTGGRKSFLPGVAAYKTIEQNHKLALRDEARALALKGNPVNEDMVDAMRVLKDLSVFSVQTVLKGDHELYAVTAGNLHVSFDAAVCYSQDVFCVPLKNRAPIVIAAAPYPMDIDLYQSQKALENGKLALEDGGVIMLVSKCRKGVGDDEFLKLLSQADTPENVMKKIDEGYRLGYHKAAKIAQLAARADIWAVTDLDEQTIRSAMMTPYENLQTAVDEAVKKVTSRGMDPRVVVLPAGSLTVPMVKA